MKEAQPAYRITLQKSQGAEFPSGVIPLPLATQHHPLMQRSPVYTGVTKGKRLVALVGQTTELAMAARSHRTEQTFPSVLFRLGTAWQEA